MQNPNALLNLITFASKKDWVKGRENMNTLNLEALHG